MFHTLKPGAQFRPDSDGRASGPDPGHRSYFSLATLSDPDGKPRLRLRVDSLGAARIEFLDAAGNVVARLPSGAP